MSCVPNLTSAAVIRARSGGVYSAGVPQGSVESAVHRQAEPPEGI